jgi:hypothetical protein
MNALQTEAMAKLPRVLQENVRRLRMRLQISERIRHNEAYLAQPIETRVLSSELSYGTRMTAEWLDGEAAAIGAENEFMRRLLE